MRISFLGSGGAFTDFRVNYHNNAIIETDDGLVLIDCGTTAVQSMKEIGVSVHDIHTVLLTHLHGDHASPEQLIFERYYTGPEGLPAFQSTHIAAPADVVAPLRRSLHPYMDEFCDQKGRLRSGGLDVLVKTNPTHDVEVGGVRFRYFRVPHVTGSAVDKPAYGIDIDDGKTRVLWSGDTTLAPHWIQEAATDVRLATIFHECTFLPHFSGTVHTHFEQLSTLSTELTERISLMHHTEVPAQIDISTFAGAAKRHQTFNF